MVSAQIGPEAAKLLRPDQANFSSRVWTEAQLRQISPQLVLSALV